MATILETLGNDIVATVGGTKYVIGAHEVKPVAEAGVEVAALSSQQALHVRNQALIAIEEGGAKLSNEVKEALPALIKNLHGTGVASERLTEVSSLVHNAAELATAEKDVAETILKNNPKAANYLTKAGEDALKAKGVDLEAVAKEAAEIAKRADNVKAVSKELDALLSVKKVDHAAVNRTLAKNIEIIDELKPSADALKNAKGYNFEAAKSAIKTEFATESQKLAEAVGKWKNAKYTIEAKLPGEALKAAEADLKAAQAEVAKLHGGKFGKALNKEIPEALQKEVAALDASFGKTIGHEVASEAGKGGRGFVSKLFLKSEAEIAEKGISGIKKLHFGKAAGWAAGIVGVAYLAGVGRNPDKGKYTEQALASQGQQAGVGVA